MQQHVVEVPMWLAGSGACLSEAEQSAALLVIQEVLATAQLLPEAVQTAAAQEQDTPRKQPGADSSVTAPEADSEARRGPARSASDAAAPLSGVGAARQQQAGQTGHTRTQEGPQDLGARVAGGRARPVATKVLKVGVELEGLRASFQAEAVFAACSIAADVKAARDLLAGPAEAAAPAAAAISETTPSSEPTTPAAKWRATVAAATGKSVASTGAASSRGGARKERPRAPKLDLQLAARLADVQADMWLSEQVCWAVHIGAVTAAYAPRCAVVESLTLTLNEAPIIHLGAAVATVQLHGVLPSAALEADAWALFGSAEAEAAADGLGRLLTGGSLVAASPLAEAAAGDEHAAVETASHVDSQVNLSHHLPYQSTSTRALS